MGKACPDIYQFTDVAEFLREFYRTRKETSSSFSYRQFARMAQVSPSLLQDVIVGRRHLSEAAARKFSVVMKLGKHQAEYLLWMIRFGKARSADARDEAFTQMGRCRSQARMKFLDQEFFEFYAHWYYSAVRLLVTLPGFQEDPRWIAEALFPRITERQARESLALLLRLQLLHRDVHGRLQLRDGILSTDYELESLAVRHYNRTMMEMGTALIDSVPQDQREISTVQCSVSYKGFLRIRERLRRFKEEVLEIATTEMQDPAAIYHMNLQLFPLTPTEGNV